MPSRGHLWEVGSFQCNYNAMWCKTSKYPIFRGRFRVLNLWWRVQNIVSQGPQHVTNQGNQLNQRLHLKKSSKSALKVAKKVTTFIPKNQPWKNSPIYILIFCPVAMVLANSNHFYFPHTFLSILLLLWHPDVAVRMTNWPCSFYLH